MKSLAIGCCIAVISALAFAEAPEVNIDGSGGLKDWVQRYTAAASEHDFRLATTPTHRLEMVSQPVQVYSHPNGLQGTHGAFYVWASNGRPEVVGSLWSFEKEDGRRGVNHELHSLATTPLLPVKIGTALWSPQAGLVPQLLSMVNQPAETPRLRLAQMRSLAARFQGFSNSINSQEGPLRLLPQPLYRGEPSGGAVLDCAVFGLFADWDPEILLLIEARMTANGYRWHYSAGRFNICRMRLTFDGAEVWRQDDAPQAYPTFGDPQGPFFAVHDVEVIPPP